jgi:hypothetical protein
LAQRTGCGQEWRKGRGHRLYDTLIDPGTSNFMLGYVDIRMGNLHAVVTASLSEQHSDAENYLRLLRDRIPSVYSTASSK